MIQTADVTKVKCILQGAISRKIDTETYSIICKKDTILRVIQQAKKILFLYNVSPTQCAGLECGILSFIETHADYCIYCDDPCTRRNIDTNIN